MAQEVAGIFPNPSLIQAKVPLNPILGETLQREWTTGEKFYAEQISHHPPITAFQAFGPEDEWEMSGSHQIKSWLNGTSSLGGNKVGDSRLVLKDGTTYEFVKPTMSLENLLSNERV